uniref:AzlC family ABC transporter permease n=1 Tax=Prevotella sp. TaxID=59823 RepID=UPI0025D9630F|nr:AzlC family ABC transporter permease [Prevotella sp.]
MATNKNEKIFHPLQAFLMVLMVNARHLFYGLSMLEKYKGLGWTIPWRRWQP